MDSRLKKITVAICVSAILLLLTVIVGVNYIQTGFGTKKKETVSSTDNQEQGSYGDTLSEEELHAFEQDAFFFDAEEKVPVLTDASHYVRVTMSLSSVLEDIRIRILDSNEQIVTGELFNVTLTYGEEEIGKYTDEDMDGIIYISGLEGGDYHVTFNETEGYRGPLYSMKVSVPEILSYEYMEDIELLISDGGKADANDDVLAHFADGDSSESTELNDGIYAEEGCNFGIEVSSLNGEIDWTKVQAEGIEFAMIRCGYRGRISGELFEDEYFRQNIEDAIAVGIKVGVYFSSQATNEREAVEEASMAIKLCKEYAVTYPIFILQESSFGDDGIIARTDSLDSYDRTAIVQAFCETIESEGYRTGVEASRMWCEQELEMDSLTKFYTYLAEYRSEPVYEGGYTFWKYTENGWVNGVTGRVALVVGYYEM